MELHPFLLIFELRRTADVLERTLMTRLDEAGWPRLTINQVLLFAHLEPDGVTAAELARRMGMSRQSMQKNLDRLELSRLDLTGWDFSGQSLAGASFLGSTLTDANLSGVNLRNASLANSNSLRSALFDSATVYNQWTRFSDDFHPIPGRSHDLHGVLPLIQQFFSRLDALALNLEAAELVDGLRRETDVSHHRNTTVHDFADFLSEQQCSLQLSFRTNN